VANRVTVRSRDRGCVHEGPRVAGAAGGEALAFDVYGTLVNPIAIAGELGQILGDSDGRDAARSARRERCLHVTRGNPR